MYKLMHSLNVILLLIDIDNEMCCNSLNIVLLQIDIDFEMCCNSLNIVLLQIDIDFEMCCSKNHYTATSVFEKWDTTRGKIISTLGKKKAKMLSK